MQAPVGQTEALTWTAFLNVLNTALIILAGFLAREAWKNIHGRIGSLEEWRGDARERLASLETASGNHPHRRRTDSGPHHQQEE